MINQLIRALFICAAMTSCVPAWAATPAGTIIRNQASAVYTDDAGQSYTVTSNVVETLVEQVAGLELVQDQQQRSDAGSLVSFPHRLTNTGNGDDRYTLQVANVGGDSLDLNNLGIYLDLDQNGIADNNTPITETPWVAAGSELFIVISGNVPTSADQGDAAIINLTASSQFNSALIVSNMDTVNVNSGAIIEFTKSISSNAGASPSGPYTVTLNYQNSGSAVANQVTLIDALPEGMVYVQGTGGWNLSAQALSDADPLDTHVGGGTNLRYCAYHSSCTNLPESQIDQDTASDNQVTAIIESLQPGESGSVMFDVEIASQLDASTIINQAEVQFDSGGATLPRVYSNAVSFTILASASVVANGSQSTSIDGMNEPVTVPSAPLAGTVSFENIIWNTGNAVDTFNVLVDTASATFPADTIYRLLKSDDATPLLDTNQDGMVDTGPVQPGEFYVVVMQLQLPFGVSGNNAGNGFDIRKTAQSSNDSSVSNDVVDHLDEIVSNQVDMTNQYPAGTAGALGTGPGPEASPVSTETLDGDGVTTFDLHVRHQGSTASSYDLFAYSTTTGETLPPGWQIVFIDAATSTVVTSTGELASGESQHLLAELTVPANANFVEQSIYFQAVSPLNGASDMKYDAVRFGESAQITLTPSRSAQVNRGGSVVYEHVITNSGNVELTDILFDVEQSDNQWQGSLYEDTDSNGFLSPADLLISGPISLLPGESADVFIKVFAPSASTLGQSNTSTIQAASAASGTDAAVTDVTTVSESQVSIRKEQAVDIDCNGQPDIGNDFSPAQIVVAPGNNCVLYRLTATNTGVSPSYNVVIRDYTPPYTLYYPSAYCSRTPCWINEPAAEETGTINAETDQLLPGDAYYLQFSVRVQ